MCRFVLYLGEPLTLDKLTTKPRHSLIHQSYKAAERAEPLNGDGFGLAWYTPDIVDPALFRSTTPAWNNPNLRELARVTTSACVLAHVRAATPPLPVTLYNCHPFKAGRIALMHNGFIPGFAKLRRMILRQLSDDAFHLIKGSTDSEHILALFVDRYQAGGDMRDALHDTLTFIEELCEAEGITRAPHLNVAVTDGQSAVVSRYCKSPGEADSLYLHTGKKYVCEGDTCRMIAPGDAGPSVIVASEALSDDPGWEKVGVNHIVTIDAKHQVRSVPRHPAP